MSITICTFLTDKDFIFTVAANIDIAGLYTYYTFKLSIHSPNGTNISCETLSRYTHAGTPADCLMSKFANIYTNSVGDILIIYDNTVLVYRFINGKYQKL